MKPIVVDGDVIIDQAIFDILAQVLFILQLAIIGRALLSWFDRGMQNPISQVLVALTEPFIAPIRQFMPRTGMLDLSPLIALFVIYFLRQLLVGAAGG